MLIKVCGLRERENIAQVERLGVDMLGFIFYEKSPRCVSETLPATPQGVERVGVFVDATLSEILCKTQHHALTAVQLHGNEPIELCRALRREGLTLIKAISVESEEQIALAAPYQGEVDYLLFDTKTSQYGGSGRSFDWEILSAYRDSTPFLLSGGIRAEHLEQILKLNHPQFAGVDLNSGFESAPAVKDVARLRPFITQLKQRG